VFIAPKEKWQSRKGEAVHLSLVGVRWVVSTSSGLLASLGERLEAGI